MVKNETTGDASMKEAIERLSTAERNFLRNPTAENDAAFAAAEEAYEGLQNHIESDAANESDRRD